MDVWRQLPTLLIKGFNAGAKCWNPPKLPLRKLLPGISHSPLWFPLKVPVHSSVIPVSWMLYKLLCRANVHKSGFCLNKVALLWIPISGICHHDTGLLLFTVSLLPEMCTRKARSGVVLCFSSSSISFLGFLILRDTTNITLAPLLDVITDCIRMKAL